MKKSALSFMQVKPKDTGDGSGMQHLQRSLQFYLHSFLEDWVGNWRNWRTKSSLNKQWKCYARFMVLPINFSFCVDNSCSGANTPDPIKTRVTKWGKDPLFYGSYSYCKVGCTADDFENVARSTGR